MEEHGHPVRNEHAWEAYMKAERRDLELRREGHLARLLGLSPAGEHDGKLEHMVLDDRCRAEEGLVELRTLDGEVYFNYIDELVPEDRAKRAEAERVRTEWVRKRIAGESFTEGKEN